MQRFKHLLPLALLGAFLTVPALAQVPRQISYQGVLVDGTGNPVTDGPHVVTLKLYDAANATLYTETQNVSTIRGLFNMMIGSVTPIPASINFTAPYSLGISVDGGAELVPRTQLASTPYALNAGTADLARGLAPGATGVVTSLNGASGDVVLQGSGGTTINRSGNTITISSVTGGGGSGIAGIQNSDGSLTITEPNGPIANISVTDGGIGTNKLGAASVTAAKISAAGALKGQVLGFNGTTDTLDVTVSGSGFQNVSMLGVNASAITLPLQRWAEPFPRTGFASTFDPVNKRVLVTMGKATGISSGNGCASDVVALTDPKSATWNEVSPNAMPDSPSPRRDAGVVDNGGTGERGVVFFIRAFYRAAMTGG